MRSLWMLLLCCSFLAVYGQNLRGTSADVIPAHDNSPHVPLFNDGFDLEEDGHAEERLLMRSTDRQAGCFNARNKANYFARNPFNSDGKEQRTLGRRGDWAKCLPTPSFAVMCVHSVQHGFNPDPLKDQDSESIDSKKYRGQLHDWHAGALYETLLEMHEAKCSHVDLELSPAAKEALDNYMLATGDYRLPEPEPDPEPEPEPEPAPRKSHSNYTVRNQ